MDNHIICKKNDFYLLLSIFILSICFPSCFIVLAETPKTMMDRSGNGKIFVLLPVLKNA